MIPVIAHEDVRVASTEGWVVRMDANEIKEFKMEHAMALISTGKAEFYKGEVPQKVEQPTYEVPEDDDDLEEFEEDQNDKKDDLPCTDVADDHGDDTALEASTDTGEADELEDTDLDPVLDAVRTIIHRADGKDLKNDGTPKAFAINRELGYIVETSMRQKAIEIVVQELDAA